MPRGTVTLACNRCKSRNYKVPKNKGTGEVRLESKKYCPHCKRHEIHRESR